MNTNPSVILCKAPRKLKGETVHYWRLRWTDSDGRSRYERLGRCDEMLRRDAQKLLREKITLLGTHPERADRPDRMSLADFADFHEKTLAPHGRPATRSDQRSAVRHAVNALGNIQLASVKRQHAGKIRDHMLTAQTVTVKRTGKTRTIAPRSEATIRKTLVTLRAMFGRAHEAGMIHTNPLKRVQLCTPVVKEKRIFTVAEIDAMLEVADDLGAAMIRLAVTTGLRKSEILHLRWQDIDESAPAIRVEEHHAGQESGVPIFAWKPKTALSARTVPLQADMLAALLRLKVKSDSPYCFIDAARLQHLASRQRRGKATYDLVNNFNRDYNAIQTDAKIYRRGTFHDLRKTFGTRAASNGVPIHELRAFMGHASITTTADYYLDVEESAAERLRAALSA